ncbi:MAG: amidase family protein, partial [Zavarzinia sp.]|nr:amidase family protein [Zavarzinia sp.]
MTLPKMLTIGALAAAYEAGTLTPVDVIEGVIERLKAWPDHAVWISRFSDDDLRAAAKALVDAGGPSPDKPLWGIPFAVKDNIDCAGLDTTAACPAFAYSPARDATVVARLRAAGAIPVGKTNLDQFATGLNGTRSPYGAPRSVFNADYISGGSSSGSAVAVGAGIVAFSLGTDTAGSGRVPASFNNLVGVKPSKGMFS